MLDGRVNGDDEKNGNNQTKYAEGQRHPTHVSPVDMVQSKTLATLENSHNLLPLPSKSCKTKNQYSCSFWYCISRIQTLSDQI